MNISNTMVETMSNNRREKALISYSDLPRENYSIPVYDDMEKRKQAKSYSKTAIEIEYISRRLI